MADKAIVERLREALAKIPDPSTGRSLAAAGLVEAVTISPQGVAKITLATEASRTLAAARAAAERVAGVTRAVVVSSGAEARPHDNPIGLAKPSRMEAAGASLEVKNVVAVASGKGGVGKSTVAANLAVALAQRGLRIGLMDADIYGPSLPTLYGLRGTPDTRAGKIVPAKAFGVKAMSIGLLVDSGKALAWRGPMVMGAIRQLMSDVDWGALDILLVDTPPGTGDAHLSLIQSKRLSGAIIVSTPQELALADVRRGVELFRMTKIPVLGVVENMAWLEAQGGPRYLFGRAGAERAAHDLGVPFLGAIPIYEDLREASDEGVPLVAALPDAPAAQCFAALAEKILASLQPA
jgi:ATP-binding protein involved in chromosome partitioning